MYKLIILHTLTAHKRHTVMQKCSNLHNRTSGHTFTYTCTPHQLLVFYVKHGEVIVTFIIITFKVVTSPLSSGEVCTSALSPPSGRDLQERQGWRLSLSTMLNTATNPCLFQCTVARCHVHANQVYNSPDTLDSL